MAQGDGTSTATAARSVEPIRAVNPPCLASRTAVSLNLTIPTVGQAGSEPTVR